MDAQNFYACMNIWELCEYCIVYFKPAPVIKHSTTAVLSYTYWSTQIAIYGRVIVIYTHMMQTILKILVAHKWERFVLT